MPAMMVLDAALWPGHTELLEVASVQALVQKTDPWTDYWKNRQTLTQAMRTPGYKPSIPQAGRTA